MNRPLGSARSRTSCADGRIIITGTGRAGTTFLVQLFTALGFDTGYSLEKAMGDVDSISHAGLEHPLIDDRNPYVIKSPWFADHLSTALNNGLVRIVAAIIPMRELSDAAESRRRVYSTAEAKGLNPLNHPGSLWHTTDPADQEDQLACQFYKAIFPLVKHEIPIFLIQFPRFVFEAGYLFNGLEHLMNAHNVMEADFIRAHSQVSRPGLIHP